MFTLRLNKGLSYSGVISASKDSPIVHVEDKKIADAAVESGYFELLEAAADDETPVSKDPQNEPPALDVLEKMKKEELETEAERRGVDIFGCKNNGERIAAIMEGAGSSITMVDLQEE